MSVHLSCQNSIMSRIITVGGAPSLFGLDWDRHLYTAYLLTQNPRKISRISIGQGFQPPSHRQRYRTFTNRSNNERLHPPFNALAQMRWVMPLEILRPSYCVTLNLCDTL